MERTEASVLVGAGFLAGVLIVGAVVGAVFLAPGVTRGASVGIALSGSQTAGWGLTKQTESIPGPTITVNQSDVVTLSLTSTDGSTHQFLLDYNGNGVADTGEPVSAFFSSSTTLTFTASNVGSFRYMCTIHTTSMYGTWKVTATNTAPTLTQLTASPTQAIPGQLVTLSSTSFDANSDVLSYSLTFGDGTTSSGSTAAGGGLISVTHAYPADGVDTATLTVNDGKGGTATSSTSVTIATSLLRVTTNPALPAKVFVDGVPRDEWGLNWMKITPGQHTVSFGNVSGFAAPAAQTVTTTAGSTTTVQGNFIAQGSLRVVTSPAVPGTISVDGVPRDDWGMWQSMPAGTYTVSFGNVADYTPPVSQSITLAAGQSLTVTGTYTSSPGAPGPDPSTFGLLRVTTNPAVPAKIVVGGVPRDEWGLNWVKLAPGMYTVSFGDVYGYVTPAAQTVTVVAGSTATVAGSFVSLGSLRIVTSPGVAATVFVNNLPRDDWGMWQSMPAGTYTVSFGPVAGYATPASQVATVTGGSLTTITGTYTATAVALAPSIQVAMPSTIPALTTPTFAAPRMD